MEEKLLNVSSSPHVRDHSSTKSIMRDVVIALLPATIVGIYNFRLSAVLVILTCCVSCVLSEYIWQRLMKQKVTTYDFSALLTGLLLGLNLPATMGSPKYLWMCILGSVFAIIVVKQLFGGLGQNFMNPALGGRCFLQQYYDKFYSRKRGQLALRNFRGCDECGHSFNAGKTGRIAETDRYVFGNDDRKYRRDFGGSPADRGRLSAGSPCH